MSPKIRIEEAKGYYPHEYTALHVKSDYQLSKIIKDWNNDK